MAFNQPATPTYVGFWPVVSAGTLAQCNPYLVSSSEASAINLGDMVCQTSINTVRIITGTYIPTSSMATVGIAASRVAANEGSTSANLQVDSSRVCLVYDDADQIFAGCDTTSGVVVGLSGFFKNYAVISTGCVGSTGPVNGRSNMVIGGATATVAGAIHIVGMHPCEMGVMTSGTTTVTTSGVRKYLFKLVSGVTIASTQVSGVANTTS